MMAKSDVVRNSMILLRILSILRITSEWKMIQLLKGFPMRYGMTMKSMNLTMKKGKIWENSCFKEDIYNTLSGQV